MIRVKVFVEGQTEETFVREVLIPFYSGREIFFTPILAETSPGHKGGIKRYAKIKPQIQRLCRQDRAATVTTLIDYYGLPADFPGKNSPGFPRNGTVYEKAGFVETQFAGDIAEPNFLPYLQLHEFEALLFVEPEKFSDWVETQKYTRLRDIRNQFQTPEHINDAPHSAPSKRIMQLMPEYQKTLHGPLIAADIGLDKMRGECGHFNGWLQKLEQMAANRPPA